MKGLGILLLLLTGTAIGVTGWLRLQRRVKALEEFRVLVRRFSQRIRYAAVPMTELFCEIDGETQPNSGEEPREAFTKRLLSWGESAGLAVDDRALLQGFSDGVGRSDVEGELRFCAQYEQAIEEQLLQAREQLKIKGRLSLTAGICGGITAVLLLS